MLHTYLFNLSLETLSQIYDRVSHTRYVLWGGDQQFKAVSERQILENLFMKLFTAKSN